MRAMAGRISLCAQLAGSVDGAVQATHRGIRLDHDGLYFPALPEFRRQRGGIRIVAFAENTEVPAVVALEDSLDPGVSGGANPAA